jgi:hypothetical protein
MPSQRKAGKLMVNTNTQFRRTTSKAMMTTDIKPGTNARPTHSLVTDNISRVKVADFRPI